MENKENITEEQNNINTIEQSEPVLNTQKEYKFPLWKRIVLFVVGLGGLYLISLLVSIPAIFAPKEYQDPIVNIVTYVLMLIALIGIVFVDIPKQVQIFKKWQNYLIGIGLGIAIILFDIFYTTILVQTYPDYSVGGNEEAVRGIIDLLPISSVFVLGIIGPICEELTYRVGLFGALNKVNKVLAYVVSTLVFASIHFRFNAPNIFVELANLPAYVVSGAILAFAYDKWSFTGSMSAHITNNLYAVIGNIILKRLK